MTNIMPQMPNMNRGAWLLTEEIAECYRDLDIVYVYGGVLWRSDDLKDDFLTSHGIHTPTDYWKILVYQGQVLAWIVPNSQDAKRSVLDNYVVNPNNLLDTLSSINVRIDDLDISSLDISSKSWELPSGCDKS